MGEGVIPTKAAWGRVAGAVTRLENTPLSNVGASSARRPSQQYRELWAEITGAVETATGSGLWHHSWTEDVRTTDSFTSGGQARSGTTTVNFAVSVSGSQIDSGTVVRLFLDFDGDGIPYWTAQDSSSTKGTLRFQVFQMMTDTTTGWDWVRFH